MRWHKVLATFSKTLLKDRNARNPYQKTGLLDACDPSDRYAGGLAPALAAAWSVKNDSGFNEVYLNAVRKMVQSQ